MKLLKFTDNAIIIDLISDDESAYRWEVDQLGMNPLKIVEMMVDSENSLPTVLFAKPSHCRDSFFLLSDEHCEISHYYIFQGLIRPGRLLALLHG